MDKDPTIEARELHRTLDYIGLRAQATTVGLIQLCAELVRVRLLDDEAVQRIKDAIHRELTVSQKNRRNPEEFQNMLRQRLDAIFPHVGDAESRGSVGTVGEMETALEPPITDRPAAED